MGDIRIVFNSKGEEEILSSAGVQDCLMKHGLAIGGTADHMFSEQHYTVAARPGRKWGRPYVVVAANNRRAIRSNAKHNTLLKSLGQHSKR